MTKILIVEDEDIIRKGLCYTIDWLSMGFVLVGEAANGEEGYEKIVSLKPEIVIADIMMPKLTGIEMIRKAREQVKFYSVILTSYAEFEYARQAIELKTSAYLMKPVAVHELIEIMRKLQEEIQKENEKELIVQQKNLGMNIDQLSTTKRYQNTYVQKAVDLMKTHYSEKISIETIADELYVSSSYLSRKFKEETGHTYLDFLNLYRVQQAVKLLDEGEYLVYQISDLTGFTDYKHFCSVFKRYMTVSPTEFRKQKDMT